MSKCLICGSQGDDLVFRFYCSNKECVNFVPNKEEKPKQVNRTIPGAYLGDFFNSREYYVKEIQAEWIVNDYVVPMAPIPEFTLIKDQCSNSLNLVWGERVPDILQDLLAPIWRNYIGKSMCCDIVDVMRNNVIQRLLDLVARRQLVWSNLYRRWELHFTE